MKYLLDTCVISELVKPSPDKKSIKMDYSIGAAVTEHGNLTFRRCDHSYSGSNCY